MEHHPPSYTNCNLTHSHMWKRWTGLLPNCMDSAGGCGYLFSQLVECQFFLTSLLFDGSHLLSSILPLWSKMCSAHSHWGPNSALLQNLSVLTVNHLSVIHQSSHDRKIHLSHLLLCNVWRCWWNETWRRPGEMTVHFIVSEHSRLQQPAPPTTPPLSNSRPIRALLHPPVHPQPHPSS